MNIKSIIISIIVLAVLAGGGYYAYTKMGTQSGASATDQTQQTAPADQVQAQEVTVGTGAEAKPGDTVSVLYVGQLQDGTVFDSSAAHNNEPLVFTLGTDGLLPGFQIGVNGMKEGGERLMAIPPALGYGAQDVKDAAGNTIIPANATLIFNVQLVKVTPATASSAEEPATPETQ